MSTRKQDEKNQRIQIKAYVEGHDLSIPDDGWFVDKAVHGWTPPMEREGFRDMYETLEATTSDDPAKAPAHVVVYEVSRLGRSFWEMLEVIKSLEEKWPIISTSPKESFLQVEDRSMRQLFLTILAWSAEREREMLVQRTKEGLVRAAEENRHSGNVPLGYSIHKCLVGKCVLKPDDQCVKHGRLQLDANGRLVQQMLQMNPKLKPRQLKGIVEAENDYQRFALIRNVRKFGSPANTRTE